MRPGLRVAKILFAAAVLTVAPVRVFAQISAMRVISADYRACRRQRRWRFLSRSGFA
jgi:hypothetical protein